MTKIITSSREAEISIDEFKQAAVSTQLVKRRKQSNYTKPRNRKKKSKY